MTRQVVGKNLREIAVPDDVLVVLQSQVILSLSSMGSGMDKLANEPATIESGWNVVIRQTSLFPLGQYLAACRDLEWWGE
jgi:hypothetical protein